MYFRIKLGTVNVINKHLRLKIYLILKKLLKLNKTCNYHITFIIISKLLHDILIIAIYNKGFIFI